LKKKYRIYVDTKRHRDIYEKLESVPRPLRGEFIRTAIRFFMDKTDSMNNLRTETAGKTDNSSRKSFSDVFG